MEMIIGGAFQGKEALARKRYPQIAFLRAGQLTENALFGADGILDFQDYIRNSLNEGKDLQNFVKELIRSNPDLVMTVREVGSGVVPVREEDRRYRETVGRVCTELADFSDIVIRVVCGIPIVLKNSHKSVGGKTGSIA